MTALLEREDPVPIEELVQSCEAEEQSVRLLHTHVPKLEENGYVEWKQEAQSLEKGPAFDEIRPALRMLREHEEALPNGWP
uniref:hypothetical protein n=1 Tax=Halomicrobium urmianum TaxID=1586233 RepID=UPI001CD9A12F|nr:hypothetical protein [Halomicrobium urmianum]